MARRHRIPTKIQIGPRPRTRREVIAGMLPLGWVCRICGQKHRSASSVADCEAADRDAMGDKTMLTR